MSGYTPPRRLGNPPRTGGEPATVGQPDIAKEDGIDFEGFFGIINEVNLARYAGFTD